MTNYKLWSNTATAGDGVASLDVVSDGKLFGILVVIDGLAGAGVNARGRMEISFASSSGFITNDTRSSIAQVSYSAITSAGAFNQMQWIYVPDIQFNQGERVFLHHTITGTALSAINITAFLYVTDKSDSSSRRVRL